MIAYYFRFIDENKQPTGWVGFAVADNMMELFWEIDQYENPHLVEVQKARSFSWCAKFNPRSLQYKKHEVTEKCDALDPDAWHKPRWPSNPFVKLLKEPKASE